MYSAYLIKYGEIGVKGKNRHIFEDALINNIRFSLSHIDGEYDVYKEQGRIYVRCLKDYYHEDVLDALSHVFGIVGICPMYHYDYCEYDELSKHVVEYLEEEYGNKPLTFKFECKRANKKYPLDSMQLNAELGHDVLEHFSEYKVDVHKPDLMIHVEIREQINIYSTEIKGPGGMPVGTCGRGMLLLSGGIDSPVAGYMVAKRGVDIEAVYFNAPPYTSEKAKQKVVDLAGVIARYTGKVKLHVINFTDIQMYIYEKCPHDELTIIMRRYMMKIADIIAGQTGCMGLITGESIGQVASQTMQSLMCTGEVVTDMPVYRPLIAFDKQDIVDISLKIDAYETSILPYEDCCTIFVAKHPVTKPRLDIIKKHEENLA
ncbi:MAG TPA: tRNA 4-thiouridine(8) synthase ThiI, partial [Eubacterium sp.]|nr:tRNA 4-thiouridine(8) synthase ThiI [Eubacterium sp.]